MQAPQLDAPGVRLTPPTVDDAPDWAAAQDEECARWFDWPGRPGVDRCRAHLQRVVADQEPDSCTWAIRTPQGFAGGLELARHHDGWNVSYFVHPDQRGRGVARRALRAVVGWAFAELGLTELTTRVHVDNVASQKVLEAVGFERVDTVPNPDADHLDHRYRLAREETPAECDSRPWRLEQDPSTGWGNGASTDSGRSGVGAARLAS